MTRSKTSGKNRGAVLFKNRFRPRAQNNVVEARIFLCPVCHEEIRQSAEICPHCRSRRIFGPTYWESGIAIGIGMAAGLFYSLAILDRVSWVFPCAALGALVGFYVAQIRFDGDRWRRRSDS
ncbi:hypothetical protein N5W20_05640 [Candidatus Kirkpatrickella diaphorinae]|uniref:Zinc ribbon domain-containing protein n=1 Tax=Candidatus Kirkpatrickella diaphorinae TaxID=2984322 RepID=A0ABY6GH87_9PROT|nr:hypothetical protein [Candidatus Kirkpatrickella diaphorinae]UYH50609.1 hypothetical protein N5W20_05640 [Candidatus Kirkpatrickella diaphorinae]